MSEFVIRGATVLDGTGGPEFVADVAVNDGRISSIGHQLPGGRAIDGQGLYLAPGFMDCHCHDDLAMLREPDRPEKIAQGVTTVVVGNCGFSLFPCDEKSRSDLRAHAGGLLGQLESDEVFQDLADYSAKLSARRMALNVAPLVGHGPLRLLELSYENRPTSPAEVDAMARRLDLQFQQGAAGFSLGLVYPPSAFAAKEELVRLCAVAARWSRPVAAHIRSYEAGLFEAATEFLEVLRASGARGVLSHLQAAGQPNWGSVRQVLMALERARAEGIDVSCDMYPYLAGSSYALQLLPPSCLQGGIQSLQQTLENPPQRTRLKAALERPEVDEHGWQSKIAVIGWDSVLIAGVGAPSLGCLEGKTFTEAAMDSGCDPFDVLVRLVLEDDGATSIVLFQLSEPDLQDVFQDPYHMVGSDGIPRQTGNPHPRAYGAFPRTISKVAGQDRWLSLPEAVQKMTSLPADRFGLKDRGRIRPGAMADLVLFEPGFQDLATYSEPRRLAEGASYVWVGGQAVWENGKPTGARPGEVLPGSFGE